MALMSSTEAINFMPPVTASFSDWQHALPVFNVPRTYLRDLRPSDAPALLRSLTTRQVTRFISPPPTTVAGFERFIQWIVQQREAGDCLCFAVVPTGAVDAIG